MRTGVDHFVQRIQQQYALPAYQFPSHETARVCKAHLGHGVDQVVLDLPRITRQVIQGQVDGQRVARTALEQLAQEDERWLHPDRKQADAHT